MYFRIFVNFNVFQCVYHADDVTINYHADDVTINARQRTRQRHVFTVAAIQNVGVDKCYRFILSQRQRQIFFMISWVCHENKLKCGVKQSGSFRSGSISLGVVNRRRGFGSFIGEMNKLRRFIATGPALKR